MLLTAPLSCYSAKLKLDADITSAMASTLAKLVRNASRSANTTPEAHPANLRRKRTPRLQSADTVRHSLGMGPFGLPRNQLLSEI